jgi:hypothetical protein
MFFQKHLSMCQGGKEAVRIACTTWALVAHLGALPPTDSSFMLALGPAFLFFFSVSRKHQKHVLTVCISIEQF